MYRYVKHGSDKRMQTASASAFWATYQASMEFYGQALKQSLAAPDGDEGGRQAIPEVKTSSEHQGESPKVVGNKYCLQLTAKHKFTRILLIANNSLLMELAHMHTRYGMDILSCNAERRKFGTSVPKDAIDLMLGSLRISNEIQHNTNH